MESGRAPFQSHTDGDHLPGAAASELVKPPGRDGRACGTPYGVGVECCLFDRLDGDAVVTAKKGRFLDSDGVGARPRQARPGRPGGIDLKRGCCMSNSPPFFHFPSTSKIT